MIMTHYLGSAPDLQIASEMITYLNTQCLQAGVSISFSINEDSQPDECMNRDAFDFLMTQFESDDEEQGRNLLSLRKALKKLVMDKNLRTSIVLMKSSQSAPMTLRSLKPHAAATAALLLDVVPAIVIVFNALIIAISADNECSEQAEHCEWDIVECFFFAFFALEGAAKFKVFGFRELMFGPDRWWNYFDFLTIGLAFADVTITWVSKIVVPSAKDTGI